MSFLCIAKNSHELPEDGVGKDRSATQLKSDQLTLVNKKWRETGYKMLAR
jgi:hypothetical protein